MLSLVDLQTSLLDAFTEPTPSRPLPVPSSELVAATYGLMEELRRAEDRTPKSAKVRPDIERQSRRLENMRAESAKEAFETAQDVFEESPTAWARAAYAMYATGDIAKAVEAARRVAEITANRVAMGEEADPPAVYAAASVLALIGETAEADALLSVAGPDENLRVLRAAVVADMGEFQAALALIGELQLGSAAVLRAWLLLHMGSPAKALAQIRSVLRESQPDPALLANMAYAFALLGSPRKAVNAARRATLLASASKPLALSFVGYLMTMNDPGQAILEIDRLSQGSMSKDPELRMTKAAILWSIGSQEKAIRVLNNLHSDISADLDQRSRAEIATALTIFRYQLGSITRARAISTLRELAGMAAGRSVYVIAALCDLVFSKSFLAELQRLTRQAEEWHSPAELLPLRARAAFLAGNMDEEKDLTNLWVEADPFDQIAVSQQIYVIGANGENFDEAANVGLKALQRLPFSDPVRNNTAYVLAMASRGEEAKEVLDRVQDKQRVTVIATMGLAELASGDIAAGCELYKEAYAIAGRDKDATFLQAALGLYQQIAFARLGVDPIPDEALEVHLPADWRDNPVLARLMIVVGRLGLTP